MLSVYRYAAHGPLVGLRMKTWTGKSVATGGGATWTTGSYDVETDTLYWTVGNPFPATDGDEREGTNFYTNCVLAMEGQTGKLRWYYQLTPHDLQRLERHRAFSLGGHKI